MKLLAALLVTLVAVPQDIPWKATWADAQKEAKSTGKLAILVFFKKDANKACKAFEADCLGNADIVSALKSGVCCKVDPEGTDAENKLWQEMKMPNPPMTYIFDPEGGMLVGVSAIKPKYYLDALNGAGPAYFQKIAPAKAALARDPNQPDKLAMLGEGYAALENPKDSATNYDKAVSMLLGKGDKGGALKVLEAQLTVYYDKQWSAQARPACQKILELDPADEKKLAAKATLLLGLADCKDMKLKEAIATLAPAVEKYKGSEVEVKLRFVLGQAYQYSKDYENARTVFAKLINDFPDTDQATLAQSALNKLPK